MASRSNRACRSSRDSEATSTVASEAEMSVITLQPNAGAPLPKAGDAAPTGRSSVSTGTGCSFVLDGGGCSAFQPCGTAPHSQRYAARHTALNGPFTGATLADGID